MLHVLTRRKAPKKEKDAHEEATSLVGRRPCNNLQNRTGRDGGINLAHTKETQA